MPTITDLERAVERLTGEPVDVIRQTPLAERRRAVEKKFGWRMTFIGLFPFIGRGSVLRDQTKSRKAVEADLDEALR